MNTFHNFTTQFNLCIFVNSKTNRQNKLIKMHAFVHILSYIFDYTWCFIKVYTDLVGWDQNKNP